jgi:hypothetical protein
MHPYKSRLGLAKFTAKTSLTALQFSHQLDLTLLFKTTPLTKKTLEDFDLIETSIDNIPGKCGSQMLIH